MGIQTYHVNRFVLFLFLIIFAVNACEKKPKSEGEIRIMYWYLDDRYLGESTTHHTKFLLMSPGWHQLEIVDQIGNRDKKRFYVEVSKKVEAGITGNPDN